MKTDPDNKVESLLVTDMQAAKMLGVCRRTVWRMNADGQLHAVRIRGCTRFSTAEIIACLTGKPTEEAND